MAARGVNRVILIGNLGNDPETRFFPDGGAVTNCSIATSEVWKDKQTGQNQERTEWHRVSFRDRGNFRLGQIAGEYLQKGSKVYIEGKLQTRKWEKDGHTNYATEIIVNELQILDGRKDGDQQKQDRSAPPASGQADYGSFDDDIPFSNYEYRTFA